MPSPIHILDPRAEAPLATARPQVILDSLAGRKGVILNNGWASMDKLSSLLESGLRKRFGVGGIVQVAIPFACGADQALLDRAAREADFAIVGLGN